MRMELKTTLYYYVSIIVDELFNNEHINALPSSKYVILDY